MNSAREILRAAILHTPRNPFREANALEAFADGAVAVGDGRILAGGRLCASARGLPERHGGRLARIGSSAGVYRHARAFPANQDHRRIGSSAARVVAPVRPSGRGAHGRGPLRRRSGASIRERAGAERHDHRAGVRSALRRGHQLLFQAACAAGIRVASGLVLSDQRLPDALLQTPDQAYRTSRDLIARHHGKGGQRYAVTPRFALSTSEAMLEVCGALLGEHSGLLFQTHLNENPLEVTEVRAAFSWAASYLEVYDRYGLAGAGSVFAHNVHATDCELERLAAAGSWVATCPCSNAVLASGMFPMRRHLTAGVRFALGTDVGAGTGFGIWKEALQCYLVQRLLPDGVLLAPRHLLYLATRAGAGALGLADETGDFTPGKSADLVRWEPPEGSPLASAVDRAEGPEQLLSAFIAQAGTESVREVWVRGKPVSL